MRIRVNPYIGATVLPQLKSDIEFTIHRWMTLGFTTSYYDARKGLQIKLEQERIRL